MKNKLEKFFSGKKVLILGFGREGRAWLNILNSLNCDQAPDIAIASMAIDDYSMLKDIKTYVGSDYLNHCDGYDIILQSPGVIIKDFISDENKAKITSQTDLLLRLCNNFIIGVTGTKGKSTTSSLIHHFLKANGKKSVLVGNIGIPPLEAALSLSGDEIIVCEMSCHQLEFAKASPNIAVLLNVFEEHLDHYIDFNAYKAAKENIYKHQTENDILIINKDCVNKTLHLLPQEKYICAINKGADIFVDEEKKILSLPCFSTSIKDIDTSLVGIHNYYNIAISLFAALKVNCDIKVSLDSLKSFNPLEHRLEVFLKKDNVIFVNDSISTTPYATIMAVKSFENVDTLIIGGTERNISYKVLVDFLNKGIVKNLIFLPDTGKRIAKEIKEANKFLAEDMHQAVDIAISVTKHCCILSPAAASYGFYKNFEERGNHFKRLVLEKT